MERVGGLVFGKGMGQCSTEMQDATELESFVSFGVHTVRVRVGTVEGGWQVKTTLDGDPWHSQVLQP